MGQRSRLQDVADAAGVSFITAWRALNQPDMVREKTAEKVRAAAQEVGYVVNAVARSLVTSKSGVVGMIVPTLEDSIFSATVQGLSDTLSSTSMEILIGISGYDATREEELIRTFVGRQIDALVLTGKNHSKATRTLIEKSGISVIEIWDVPSNPLDLYVGFSNRQMAEDATFYLIRKGYRHITYVSPENRARAVERLEGYKAAMKKAGLEDKIDISWTEPTLQGGAEAFERLVSGERRPDAIFFNGDTLAVGAHLRASALSVRIPDDVAIMGLHDTDIASQVTPQLTTVRIPRYEIGRIAGEEIIGRIADGSKGNSQIVAYEIIERRTT